jgi:glyoxylase-like metal-dependent hydrolase (beta-lactamase superfamily II)
MSATPLSSSIRAIRRHASVAAIALAALAGLGLPGLSVQAQPEVGRTKIRLYVIDCGRMAAKDKSRWSPGVDEGVSVDLSDRCYLIKHPKGTLLWNTGLNDAISKNPDGEDVAGGAIHVWVQKHLADQLKQAGVEPKDITYITFSHMHQDHAGNANLFTNSTLIMQEEEYDASFGTDPSKFRFNPLFYGKLKANPVIKLKGDLDVFGDGSVQILRSPGHTPGHQCLYLNLPRTGPVLLSGDLWHWATQREFKRVPAFNFDRDLTLASMERIESFVKQHGAKVWIEHDAQQNASIDLVPDYYE